MVEPDRDPYELEQARAAMDVRIGRNPVGQGDVRDVRAAARRAAKQAQRRARARR